MSDLFHDDRLEKLERLRSAGVDPYPVRTPDGRESAAALAAAADDRAEETVVAAGRIQGRRGYGKMAFVDLADGSGKIQLCLQKDRLSAADFALLKELNLGDIVAVQGDLGRTQKGEPTIFGDRLWILSKALLTPPEKWHGLQDVEQRARLRPVDLFSNDRARSLFQERSAILAEIRAVLAKRDYLEVETPVLHPVLGGAAARPFTTHHNTLDLPLYLRIAPELYLKRLLVGGMERVFEMARVFRNEGVSNRHNPEFTMLESYQAYADYRDMIELTETLVASAAAVVGKSRVEFRGEQYDLEPPFERVHYFEEFEKALGFLPDDFDAVRQACSARELPVGPDELSLWKAANDLFEAEVEPGLRGPVFVLDYPAAICPLAKPSPTESARAERFEFFLGGMELANAFSELNDPQLQLENFRAQVAAKDPEGPNAVDLDYVRALAYGMPPAGGLGLGVDRLCMVLLGLDSIRDVLLFPLLRPSDD